MQSALPRISQDGGGSAQEDLRRLSLSFARAGPCLGPLSACTAQSGVAQAGKEAGKEAGAVTFIYSRLQNVCENSLLTLEVQRLLENPLIFCCCRCSGLSSATLREVKVMAWAGVKKSTFGNKPLKGLY